MIHRRPQQLGELRNVPAWCSWMPFADFMSTCAPLSEQELAAAARESAAKLYPTDQAAQSDFTRELEQLRQRVYATDPVTAAENVAIAQHPTIAAWFGPIGAQVAKTASDTLAEPANVILIAGVLAGAGVLVLLSGSGRRRR